MTKVIKIKDLYEGQIVLTAASRNTGTVVRKVAKNLYEVNVDGRVFTMNRNAIAVKVYTRFLDGPFNEKL
jgi:hypothetical protein